MSAELGTESDPSGAAAAPTLGEQAAIGRLAQGLFGTAPALVAVGRYEIIEKLGSGSFGVVYRAHDPELDRDVAIKLAHRGGDAAWFDRQRRESQTLARLCHPNIVAIFDVGTTDDGRPFLAMELVAGRDLRRQAAIERDATALDALLDQAAAGLAAAHRAGVIHRDVKPDNILVGEDGRVRVGDFGLAHADGGRDTTTAPRFVGTEAGAIASGTPAYMAPELWAGAAATAASDQFAFCICAFEILTGTRPFVGRTPHELAAAIVGGEIVGLERVPARWRATLQRGLRADPSARHPDMDALRRARRSPRPWLLPLAAGCVATMGLAWPHHAASMPTDCGEDPDDARAVATLAARETERSRARIDVFAEALTETTRNVCTGASSISLFDRQVLCLQRARLGLAALADAASRTTSPAGAIVAFVDQLPVPTSCRDPAEPDATAIDPDDRLALEAALADARARFLVGDDVGAIAAAERATTIATRVGSPAAQAQAALWAGQAWLRSEQPVRALGHLESGFAAALHGESPRLSATIALVAAAASRSAGRVDAVERWLREADAAIARLGDEPVLRARIAMQRANVLVAAGDYDGANALLTPALASLDPADVGELEVTAIHDAGVLALGMGRYDDAASLLSRAAALARTRHGDEHPIVANAVGNLGLVDLARGRYAEAEAEFRIAMASGAARPTSITWQIDLGIVRVCRGDQHGAIEIFRAALAQADAAGESLPFERMQLRTNLAEALSQAGEHDEARAMIVGAGVELDALVPADHPAQAVILATRAAVERRAGQVAASLTAARRAAAIPGLPDPIRAPVLLELGESLAAAGDRDAAIAVLEQAQAHRGFDARVDAQVAVAMARLLAERGDHDAAIAIATPARDAFPQGGDPRLRAALVAASER